MQKRHPLCFQFDRSNRTSGHLLRSITAKATDNSGNAASNTTSSAPIQLTVTAGVAQVYYIHTDQLNTPRLITNSANAKVWEWNNDDPFANNPVNDDPNATGNHFTYNPRLPGQYFDSETNTNYNYYRDYDPSTGRYIESDPIGLNGGINTYGYVGGNPIGAVDPRGLDMVTLEKLLPLLQNLNKGEQLALMRDISELAAKDRAMLLGLSSGALAAYLLLHSGNLNDGEDEFLSKYLAELENKKRFEKLNGPFHTYDCKAY